MGEGSGFGGSVFAGSAFAGSGFAGSGFAGSAFAFGMMENLSLKVCDAAGFACIPTNADIVAIAIVERRRMMASHKQIDNAKSPGCVPAPGSSRSSRLVRSL
jgi:hypothetical protein